MLNIIWMVLIFVGTLVAVGQDLFDLSTNRYQNGKEIRIDLRIDSPMNRPHKAPQPYPCTVMMDPSVYGRWAGQSLPGSEAIRQKAELYSSGGNKGTLHIFVDENTPLLWKEIFKAQKNPDYLLAKIRWGDPFQPEGPATISFDPIRFTKVQAITNDGLIHYAKVAVELAIGLIGIMALWLGLMKIAEQAGMIERLARALRGITTRLFPDVPPDHPAMGAMIMNMSANMLGLGNAATPLGLKAMEELNKLNEKPGTATDAMCTFLVINTSSVQLIPATVIAIRAAAGSANPTEILGPVIIATTINTLCGILAVKFLARLPLFKKQLKIVGR
ncbi:MAG: nucleoside recognition domain-containing protein [Thermodesulfobacteriota bacterium]